METSDAHPSSNHELDHLLNKLSLHTGCADLAENYQYLKVTFDVIRKYTSFEDAIKFNEILPLPFKAIFLDGWQVSSGKKKSFESIDQMAEKIVQHSDGSIATTTEARRVLRKVFALLGQLTSSHQRVEGFSVLPKEFRSLLSQDPGSRFAYSDACIWLS